MNEPLNFNELSITIDDAAKFAPVVRFHAKEEYYPCSIDFLLSNATLIQGNQKTPKPQPSALFNARYDAGAYLQIDTGWNGQGPVNNLIPAPMYVAVQVPKGNPYVDFHYFFLSAYNGPQAAWVHLPDKGIHSFNCAIADFGDHQGDLEHITVRVTPDLSRIIQVTYLAHGRDFARTYPPSQVEFENGFNPVVHCALFSHASYNPKDASRFINPQDPYDYRVETDTLNVGVMIIHFMDDIEPGHNVWRPFTAGANGSVSNGQLVFIGFDKSIDNPINGQVWTSFPGRYGIYQNNIFTEIKPIREDLTEGQILGFEFAVKVAEPFIPSSRKEGDGPTGFGDDVEELLMVPKAQVVVSSLYPTMFLSVNPDQPTGDLIVQRLNIANEISAEQTWTINSANGNGTTFVSPFSGLEAGVPDNSPPGTPIQQYPPDPNNPGQLWTIGGDLTERVAIRPSYNDDDNARADSSDPTTQTLARIGGWHSGKPFETWGILPVDDGGFWASLICLYPGIGSNMLWWSIFDKATGAWVPDAEIGSNSTLFHPSGSGAALAYLDGVVFCVYRDFNDSLWWTSMYADTNWSVPASFGLSMSTHAAPSLATLDKVLYCVHKGAGDDSRLFWTCYDVDSNSWIQDVPIQNQQPTKVGPALAAANNKLYCVYAEADKQHLLWTSFDGHTWQDCQTFGSGMAAWGMALANLNETLYCVHWGTDNRLWWTSFDGTSWQFNQLIDKDLYTWAAPSLATLGDKLYCVYLKTDENNLRWMSFDPASQQWTDGGRFNFNIRAAGAPALLANPWR